MERCGSQEVTHVPGDDSIPMYIAAVLKRFCELKKIAHEIGMEYCYGRLEENWRGGNVRVELTKTHYILV